MLKKFAASNEMTTVSNLFTNINTFNDYQDSTSSNYVDEAISRQKILDWNETVNNYRLGITKDVDPLLSTDDSPTVALTKMNQYSNEYTGASFPHCSKDHWVFDVADCTDPSEAVYSTPATEAEGQTIDTNFITCISLNLKLSQSSPSNWTERDIASRYVQIKQDCPQAYDGIVEYAESITNYRDSRENLFQSINQQLTDLHSSHLAFEATMNNFRNNLASFSS